MPHVSRLLILIAVVVAAPFARAQSSAGFDPFGEAKVELRIVPRSETVAPGGQALIAVVLDHEPGWHAHVNEPQIPESWGDFGDYVIPTVVGAEPTAGVRSGATQYPEPHVTKVDFLYSGEPDDYLVYDGRAVMYVPLLIDEDASGEITVPVSVQYQVCNDNQCLAPEMGTHEVTFRVVDATLAGADAPDHGDLFDAFEPSVYATIAGQGDEASEPAAPETTDASTDETAEKPTLAPSTAPRTFFGITLPGEDSPARLVILALLAAVGGFILNLTPCVLPVLPIKVMTISKHAGSPGKSLFLGLWMALGVIAFWLGLGLPVAFATEALDPSRLFGIWWVTLGIGLVIAAMGVGIMGLFTINLPDKAYMINPKADSAWGSFLFGVMTAVLGLPCFGFVAGALLAGAATMPASTILTIFGALGVGMALPYLVLSAKPSWVDKLPRTGPASELVKQVMGLLLLAAAAYFAGSGLIALVNEKPWLGKQLHWWAVAIFAGLAGLWLLVRTFQITKSMVSRAVFTIAALIVGGVAVLYALDSTGRARESYEAKQAALAEAGPGRLITTTWIDYDQRLLDQARQEGYTVVLDFTAEWCLNCKALKAAVLNRDPVKGRLAEGDVVTMTVDLTSTSAPGWDKLRSLGQTGIPLLAVYAPDADQPWLANSYGPDDVLGALGESRAMSAR